MFCPSCGSEYTIELKYCNRCGANLSTAMASPLEPVVVNLTKPTLIIGATLAVLTLGGFAALIAGTLSLARVVNGTDPLMAVIMFGMFTILIVDIFLVRQLSKLINASLSTNQPKQMKQTGTFATPPASQFARPVTPRLEPAPSVTENTTRFFEPAYRAPAEPEERATAEKLDR